MINLISDIIGTTLEVMILYNLQRNKTMFSKKNITLFSLMIPYIIGISYVDITFFPKIISILLLTIVITKFTMKTSFKRILFAFILYLLSISIGEIIGFGIFRLIFNTSIKVLMEEPAKFLLVVIVSKVFMLAFVIYLRNFIHRANAFLDKHVLLTITPLLTCFITLFIETFKIFNSVEFDTTKNLFSILSISFALVSAFCIIVLIEKYLQTKEVEAFNHLNINQISTGYHYLSQKVESHEKILELYHDLKNHLIILQSKNENSDYIDGLLNRISDFEHFDDTGNQILNTIIYEKTKVSLKNQIDFQSFVDLSRVSGLQDFDLCSIFGNAIDNAIEACMKIPNASLRRILIKANKINNFLLIKIENSVEDGVLINKEHLETTKNDSLLHGHGLKSIHRAVCKYNGEMEVTLGPTSFRLSIAIPL
jgi:hypothetical protein